MKPLTQSLPVTTCLIVIEKIATEVMSMWRRLLIPVTLALAMAAPSFAQTAGQPKAEQAQPSHGVAPASGFISAQEEGQILSSDFVGLSVTNSQGENLGKVSDLIVGQDDRIVGAILSVGGFLGIGAKSVAVPLEALHIQSDDSGTSTFAVVEITTEMLGEAPEFRTLAQLRAEAQERARQEQMQQQMEQ